MLVISKNLIFTNKATGRIIFIYKDGFLIDGAVKKKI